MTKTDLVNVLMESAGCTKIKATAGLEAVLAAIITAVSEGDKVQISGFGTFEQRTRAAHEGRNPQTGERIKIAEAKLPAFKAGKSFKETVNS